MPLYPILNRWTLRPVVSIKTESLGGALQLAIQKRISLATTELSRKALTQSPLMGADLRTANLRASNLSRSDLSGANLRGADLRGACLEHCLLHSADLRAADLRGASLRGADLRLANLVNADLRNTDLTQANFSGTVCDWQWGVMAAEILRRDKQHLAIGIPLVLDLECVEQPRPFGWIRLLAAHRSTFQWAAETLDKLIMPGDNAPAVFRYALSNVVTVSPNTR